jgi:alkanesulfonate monooxygenase SsuD/methylene tetrahydromethanopterin reductase-like flavin-dependent oxidoreductase (luciferase family)
MKILVLTLITNGPDPVTGRTPTPNARLHRVVENAVLAEELGYDGYAVGERHERPFLSSAPPVVLSHIAARTSRITLFTGVTTLALLDPVRAYEDYATLDQLADGRLELIIGKGNGAAQAQLFAVTTEDQWERNAESYSLFRRLWREERTTWSGRFRPPLTDAETWPPPRQRPIRVWHGSATSRESVELAARHGDPLFSANVTHSVEPYAELVARYRERWAAYGHDPADALVGAGTAAFHLAPTTQQALEEFRPGYAHRLDFMRRAGIPVVFPTLEDFVEHSSALIGSPAQIVDKALRYHEALGHEVLHLHLDGDGLTPRRQRGMLEQFQSDVAPALRAAVPSRPLAGPLPRDLDDARPVDDRVGVAS